MSLEQLLNSKDTFLSIWGLDINLIYGILFPTCSLALIIFIITLIILDEFDPETHSKKVNIVIISSLSVFFISVAILLSANNKESKEYEKWEKNAFEYIENIEPTKLEIEEYLIKDSMNSKVGHKDEKFTKKTEYFSVKIISNNKEIIFEAQAIEDLAGNEKPYVSYVELKDKLHDDIEKGLYNVEIHIPKSK